VKKAVVEGIDQKFINDVEEMIKDQKLKASRSQVRNIFTAVKQLEARGFEGFNPEDFLMLRPRLAYAASRDNTVRVLRDILGPAIDEVLNASQQEEQEKRFHRFCLCCEAIVAYMPK